MPRLPEIVGGDLGGEADEIITGGEGEDELPTPEPEAPTGEELKALIGGGEEAPSGEELKALVGSSPRGEANPLILWAQGFNAALADLLDMPGNLTERTIEDGTLGVRVGKEVNRLRDVGIDEDIEPGGVRGIFADLGMAPRLGEEPQDSKAYAGGRLFGDTLMLLAPLPMARELRVQRGVEQALPPLVRGGREIVENVAQTLVRSPVTTTAVEATAATTAGAGGVIAKEKFPDSLAAEGVGMIIGGLSPLGAVKSTELLLKGVVGAAKILPLSGAAVDFITEKGAAAVRQWRQIVTESGARRRATDRVGRDLKDKDAAVRNLDESNVLPDAELTPAQRANDRLLYALEKSIIESSDALAAQSDEQLAQLNDTIIRSLQVEGNPQSTQETFEASQRYLLSLLDGRLRAAALEAEKRIAALGPNATEEEANLIAREQIEQARAAARATGGELFDEVSAAAKMANKKGEVVDLRIPPKTAKQVLHDELTGRNRVSDPEDIPDFVLAALGRLKKGELTAGKLGKKRKPATFDELKTLRSRILKEIRTEEKAPAPNRNKLRILENLQEALLADMGAQRDSVGGEVGFLYRRALDYYKDLSDRFSRGPIGKLLGKEVRGAPATPPSLTLHATLGMSGPKSSENARAIVDAVKFARQTEETPELLGAMEDFLKARFIRDHVRGGRIRGDVEGFIKRNERLLEDFPDVRRDIEGAAAADDVRALRQRKVDSLGKRLANPRISKATLFIQKSPHKAFDDVRADRNVERETQNLINKAAKDKTGEASKGLQAAFYDWITSRATVAATDVRGSNFVSGVKLQQVMDDPATAKMISKILTPKQQERLKQTLETAHRMEGTRTAKQSKEGVMGDAPSALATIMFRVSAAQFGRVVAGLTGGGTVQTPGIFSERARALLESGVRDPAKKLLVEAFTNDSDDMFEVLLRGMDDLEVQKEVRSRIMAWMVASLNEMGFDLGGSTADEEMPVGP